MRDHRAAEIPDNRLLNLAVLAEWSRADMSDTVNDNVDAATIGNEGARDDL
jgi:hypothetical protein